MKEAFGTATGRIDEDTTLHGATEGEVTVASGVHLTVVGAIAGPMIIEDGAVVTVNGTVVAPVKNAGHLEINGLVLGDVTDVGAGITKVNLDLANVRVQVTEPHPRAAHARRLHESLSDTTIDSDLVVNGSVSNVLLAEGVFVEINGSVSGDIFVARTAELRINGSVGARIRNQGRVDVYGSYSGTIINEDGGSSEVHQGEPLYLVDPT